MTEHPLNHQPYGDRHPFSDSISVSMANCLDTNAAQKRARPPVRRMGVTILQDRAEFTSVL